MKRFPLTSLIPGIQTECTAAQFAWHNSNAGVFCKGSACTPLLLSLCYWSWVSVVGQISPTIMLKSDLARKKPKQNKTTLKSKWPQEPRQRCDYFALVAPCLVPQDSTVLCSKIVWKESSVLGEGEKFCVTVTSVRSKSYDGSPCPDDAGLVCSSWARHKVSAALLVL